MGWLSSGVLIQFAHAVCIHPPGRLALAKGHENTIGSFVWMFTFRLVNAGPRDIDRAKRGWKEKQSKRQTAYIHSAGVTKDTSVTATGCMMSHKQVGSVVASRFLSAEYGMFRRERVHVLTCLETTAQLNIRLSCVALP